MPDSKHQQPKTLESSTVPYAPDVIQSEEFVLLQPSDWDESVEGAIHGVTINTGLAEEVLETVLESVPHAEGSNLETIQQIGAGGMGKVDLVEDLALRRKLAKKSLLDRISDQEGLKAFVREARITAQLAHPSIVPIHELRRDDEGRLYFTMKLVEGRSLSEILQDSPPPPLAPADLLDLLEILVKVCDALAFAHDRGVIHCDLKPSNIMVGHFGEVYLMDWGIARVYRRGPEEDHGLSEARILGTPAYMSPEQASGMRTMMDSRSDIFSLGAVLYRILTGRPPYGSSNMSLTIVQAALRKLRPPSEIVRHVPSELERIALKAMAYRPKDRYRTAKSLKSDLVRFMRGESSFTEESYTAGSVIVREGDPGDKVYFIISGLCKVYKSIDGEQLFLREMGPGEIFGETALLSPGPRTASVEATEDTAVYAISENTLKKELDAMKPWMGALIRTVADRFRERDSAVQNPQKHK
jgi:serine/threonine-protein kinase